MTMQFASGLLPPQPGSEPGPRRHPALASRRLSYREFIRALAQEVDASMGPQARDQMLRGVGRTMAALLPLPTVETMEALEIEMNERLHEIGWGAARLDLREDDRALEIVHADIPRVGSAGDPPGLWLLAVLEGLYQGWIAGQPGGDETVRVRREAARGSADAVILRCARP